MQELTHDEETVSNLLSVPLDFILSHTKQQNKKQNQSASRKRKLLLGEASCLIQVRLLASEIDILLDTASEVLGRRIKCHEYSEKIVSLVGKLESRQKRRRKTNDKFYPDFLSAKAKMNLRSVIPILHTIGEHSCLLQLSYIESEMSRCLRELENCSEVLRQFSEQNLSVAEQILEMFPTQDEHLLQGNSLANEKMVVGEIEEAICTRINALVQLSFPDSKSDNKIATSLGNDDESEQDIYSHNTDGNIFETEKDPQTGRFVTMKSLCSRTERAIFGTINESDEERCSKSEDEKKETSTQSSLNEATKSVSLGDDDSDKSERNETPSNLAQIAEAIDAEADQCDQGVQADEDIDESTDNSITLSMNIAATALSALQKNSDSIKD